MLTVLVVDDEPGARAMLAMALRTPGIDVDTAGDASEALDKLTRTTFDWIVSDIRMPGEDGASLSRKIASRALDTKVVLISAVAGEDAIADLPIAAFYRKPFDPLKLRDYILANSGRKHVVSSVS